MINDDEFWSATDQLKLIHQWARASYVAPLGLLFAVLLRVSASTGPGVMLPGPPAPASLNQGVVFVGRSGAGKGVTDKVGRVVWPADIHEEGLGSGQGIAELFKEQKNAEDRITRALISVSEIDHLAALNAGQGNNTRAAVKAALTGDRLGSKGASAVTTRSVPADSYRLAMSISAQYGHTAVLMDDVTGGTPQRLLWAPVTDPDMPDEPGPIPDEVLNTKLPSWALSGQQTLIQYGPDAINEYVRAGLLANGRGDGDAIDGHRTLTRLKVAADLAILDHRSVVSDKDWMLSEFIMAKSDDTRNTVLEYDRRAARERARSKAIARATGEDFYDQSRLETVKRSILRMLENDGEQSGGDLRRRLGKREKRELFDQAVALLENAGLVASMSGEHNSVRYRIGSPVTYPVTPQMPSSEGVTALVTRDHPATVTDLDTRRSQDSDAERVPCPKWMTQYLEQLRAKGKDTVESFAVYQDGMAAGYAKANLKQTAANHPDVRTIDRRGRGGSALWSINPAAEIPVYQPARQWLDDYLDRHAGETIDPADVQAAAARDGYPWHSIRRAASRSLRLESLPAHGDAKNERIWRISADQDADDGCSA
ncbi:hypothetical protein ASE48_10155 [Mycobacterium sp. Root265]|uniref:hypothetical protein n=1 Tax=Mycobacterium sp. Root265 TaxID=1736504 RepID=UPI00070DBCE8|nr:hypothetical protein [Mycobacterium sp. Root265]KRD07790.1 hypothetical protein ASE48_10155 [Mycobacterium sp. Root265]